MQVTTLLSVVSSAVVVAALSSSVVQLQPTSVLVSAAPASAAQPAAAQAVVAQPPRPVAAPARPLYVAVPAGGSTLSLTASAQQGAAPTVDVLACTSAWTEAGECLGRQAAVLRDVVVEEAVARAVDVPGGTPHLRVSVHGGEVAVSPVAGAPVAVALPRP